MKHSFAYINFIKKNINFEPIVNFNDGLKNTIKYYGIGN